MSHAVLTYTVKSMPGNMLTRFGLILTVREPEFFGAVMVSQLETPVKAEYCPSNLLPLPECAVLNEVTLGLPSRLSTV